jgi:DNA-binding NarL/FixJ family response regulator
VLFPLLWFKRIFLSRHTARLPYLKDKSVLNQIYLDKRISKREQEIFELILFGKSNHEIEKELNISLNTVKNHIQNIYTKLNVRSRTKLMQLVTQKSHVNSNTKPLR